jgi:hypothetical protein
MAANRQTLRWSGYCYLLLFPILRVHRVVQKRRSRELTESAG